MRPTWSCGRECASNALTSSSTWRTNPVASALMSKMKIAPQDRAHVEFECLRLMTTLQLNPAKMQLIAGFVDTDLRLNETEQPELRTQLAGVALKPEAAVMHIVSVGKKRASRTGGSKLPSRRCCANCAAALGVPA